MKKFLSVLLMVAGLMSCGDDDKPFIPELNKLTSVTCTKNGNAFFNANITYDQDKQINRIILNTEGNQFTDNYIIVDKTISVSGVKMIDGSPTNPFVHTVYTLSGNMIAAKEEKSENKYMSNAVYTAVENRYTYSSNWLKSVSQIIQWPNEDGSGYQIRELGEVVAIRGKMEMRCIMLICHRKRLHMNIILNYVQRTFRSELSIHFNRSALM